MSLNIDLPPAGVAGPASPLPGDADYSPGPPLPIQRERPRGPDPFAEERARIMTEARAGAPCPVNQHGCMYFSASEWRFCNMCEWIAGHGMGVYSGELVNFGGPVAEHAADVAAGRVVRITRDGLDELFRAPGIRSFRGLLQNWTWERLEPVDDCVVLTRKQLHNLLMEYGSPSGCLTDQLWLDLQARWPPAPPGA
jgi:hypothetical protein